MGLSLVSVELMVTFPRDVKVSMAVDMVKYSPLSFTGTVLALTVRSSSSGQSAGNFVRWARVLLSSPLRSGCGSFSHP